MPRPTTKDQLLNLSQKNYLKLQDFIDSIPKEIQLREFPEGTLNRNIRDVLAHLHHWHLMMIDWYTIGMRGTKPDIPAKGYTWKTLPDLNRKIWEMYKNVVLETVKIDLEKSFKDIQQVIERHTDDELFEKKRYHWTGTTSLGAYLISCTSSHYDWALKLIKKAIRDQ